MKYVLLFLLLTLLGMCSARNHENVALRGKATQSHRYPHNFGDASSAIDGNRESNFDAGSCTHTIEMDNPWWRVDLLDSYIVTSVVITNRGDCCAQRLNGAEVHIGDNLKDNGAANPLAGTISHIPAGISHTLTPSTRISGRYVTIVLPGASRYLTLCEVEVYGYHAPTGDNLALKGKASQSSLYTEGNAYFSIDGNNDNDRAHGSCSHTDTNFAPWWRLDLLKTHKVDSVKITNRQDLRFYQRLNGAELRIGDSLENNGNNNSRCAVVDNIPAGATVEFQCNGMDGRYVNVFIPGRKEYLTLCEVEVYGSVLD
ncbi:fucolectin-1-like [Labrus mixtus]|uniref:fucolectin-1-like n=1 Tax=Labrus mixtus TaxID=508554 RepID=UPI0029C03A72|nr:fucolectin-1-like [Labrus mixtus]